MKTPSVPELDSGTVYENLVIRVSRDQRLVAQMRNGDIILQLLNKTSEVKDKCPNKLYPDKASS